MGTRAHPKTISRGGVMMLVVIGAGGHAKVVVDAAERSGWRLYGLLDVDSSRHGEPFVTTKIRGGDELLPHLKEEGVTHFIVGIGSVGNPVARKRAFAAGLAAGLEAAVVIHPNAIVADPGQIGGGTLVAAGAVINPDARVGTNVIINTHALVEHDAEVGAHAHLAPGCRVLGGCAIGDRSHIGAGAIILQGVRVGADVMVAAGAVVLGDVPNGVTMMGVPAKQRGKSDLGS